MNKTFIVTIVLALGLLPIRANAMIIDVNGPLSSAGYAAEIIEPPTDVLNDMVTNLAQQGFDEVQGVVTSADYNFDDGVIPEGTLVDSHMIFLNAPPGPNIYQRDGGVTWTFSGPIIGVMSDSNGNYEVASTPELGVPDTNYPAAGFAARGLDSGDSYTIAGNQLILGMGVDPDAGDWIRVITAPTAPITELEIDIKPGSCPNPLNVKSQGVLPVAILGTEDLDVTDIDVGAISLAGVAPIRFDYEDVATPFEGELCDCHKDGPDGYFDLTLKFDTQEIVTALGDVEDGEYLPLTLSATLVDGTVIEGSDCIRVIKKGKD
jgi:hypothetical protein